MIAIASPPKRMSKCEPWIGNSIQPRFSVACNSDTANTLLPVLLYSQRMRIRAATAYRHHQATQVGDRFISSSGGKCHKTVTAPRRTPVCSALHRCCIGSVL